MGLLSNILDPIFSSDTSAQDKAAKDALKKARSEYDIPLPKLDVANPISLNDLGGYSPDVISSQNVSSPDKVSYDLGSPQLASLFQQDPSAYGNISTDPRLRSNQEDAISSLRELSDNGGFNNQDLANLARTHSDAVSGDRARRDAIDQNMGARGMSSSGMSLLSKLQSSQAATDRESQYGLDVAGQGQDRALQAIMQSGQLSGQMQGQDFDQQAKVAQAKDAISNFNAANANSNSLANAGMVNQQAMNAAAGRLSAGNINASNQLSASTGNANRGLSASQGNQSATNAARANNSANSQNVSNSNVSNLNTAQRLREGLPQQNFDNMASLASGRANADAGLANSYQNDAARIAAKDAGYLGGIIQGGTAIATSGGSEAKKKKDQ